MDYIQSLKSSTCKLPVTTLKNIDIKEIVFMILYKTLKQQLRVHFYFSLTMYQFCLFYNLI